MIVVRIRGGLGNQFFSYARGYALAKKNNTKYMIDDFIYNTSYMLRSFKLLDYNISYDNLFIKNFPTNNKFEKILLKIWNRLKWKIIYRCKYIIEGKDFEYQEILIESNHNYYLNGYWQVHEYFDEYKSELKKEFQLKNISETLKEESNKMKKGNYCVVHVRRGDYKTFNGGKCLSIEYYQKAIQIMNELMPNTKYLFFSDDISYCKNNFGKLENVEFIEEKKWTDEEEMYLMSCCNNYIIANSSFSWWAAYLSENEKAVVISPVVDIWKENYYPKNWIKLNTNLEK